MSLIRKKPLWTIFCWRKKLNTKEKAERVPDFKQRHYLKKQWEEASERKKRFIQEKRDKLLMHAWMTLLQGKL